MTIRFGWTQPACEPCFKINHPGKGVMRFKPAELENCCFCNNETKSGIYVRVDPKTVPYPSIMKE